MIEIAGMLPLTALALFACWYAQTRIRSVAGSMRQLLLGRLILLVVGLGFAVVMVRSVALAYDDSGVVINTLVFLSSFGAVHVPAAFIILIKRVRRAQGIR